jgi:hypothetical protein
MMKKPLRPQTIRIWENMVLSFHVIGSWGRRSERLLNSRIMPKIKKMPKYIFFIIESWKLTVGISGRQEPFPADPLHAVVSSWL